MIARLFIAIYTRVSFTLAVAVFTTTWSWVASFYGFFFVYATVNFQSGEVFFLLSMLIACTGVAIFLHLAHFGLFHRLGFSGFSKTISIINSHFQDKRIFASHNEYSSEEISDVYGALVNLPKKNLYTAFQYTAFVVIILAVAIYLYSNDHEKVFFVIVGGMFASLIIGYCTFLITEYFIGPYKVRLEQLLFERALMADKRNLLSVRVKSIIMIMLVLFSMIILTILIYRSEKQLYQILIFILLSITNVGLLIFLMINNLNISLDIINRSTRKLAAGGIGLFFPPFSDKEFMVFSENYNRAALEINDIRTGLENKITERTEELSAAYERLNRAYGQIQADLNLAKRIQKRLMPENFNSIEGLDMIVHYYPMADIGGDIYDITQLHPGYVRVFLADAIGHGIQAALITMIIKSEYEKVKTIEDSRELLEWLNRSFTDLYISLNAFFSCIIIDIDIPNKKLVFSSAGHPDQIHVSGDSVEKLKHTGRLVGIKRDTRFDCVERSLKTGDKILLYTDGLFEQFNENDEGLTENDIIDIVEQNSVNDLRVLEQKLIASLWQAIGNENEQPLRDDITLICIGIGKVI